MVTLSPRKFLLSHHPRLIDSRTCQDGPGFPPSSYQNQKFIYKKSVSAKDNLKCCIFAGEGGKPGNEVTDILPLKLIDMRSVVYIKED